jgi:hypothetical protein
MLSGEATNTNFIFFGLIQPGLEPTIFRTRGERAMYDKCHNTVVIVVQLILVTDLLIFGYVQSLNNMV